MRPALLFFAAVSLCVVAHVGAMALVGWRVGATVEEVSFFFGSALIRFRYRGVSYRVGVIATGGFVRFKGDRDKPKGSEEIMFAADIEPPGLLDLHPLKRVVIAASGCGALLTLAALCLGPWASVRSLGRGFVQLSPFAQWTPAWVPEGKELAGRFVSLFRHGPFRVALGVLAAKFAAFNLLPLPPLNGGLIVADLLGWRKRLPENVSNVMTFVGMLVSLILIGYWIIQFAAVFLQLL
jgi:membrane-associated protease RseP (regulator of RpoE activity)